MAIGTNLEIAKIGFGEIQIAKVSLGNELIYSAGNIVTYYVDADITYTEEVDSDETVLSPKTFIPTKSGWEFVGWKQNTTASEDVLRSLCMGDDPITLYAMFQQTVTVTYYNGNTTKQTAIGYKYYNNGNTVNPAFTIAQTALSGWSTRGWSTATTGNGGITYKSLNNTVISENVTLYGMYQQTITLTLYNGSTTASKPTGIRYYNPGSGAIVNPTFTVAATSISGWSFRGWSIGSAANGAISYTALSNTTFSSSTTLWGLYQQTITLSYNANGGSGTTAAQTGTRYYSSAGTYVNPSFTIKASSFSRSGYTFVQWRLNGTSGTAYKPNASITLSANATMYAEWKSSLVTTSFAFPNRINMTNGSWMPITTVTVASGAVNVKVTPNIRFYKDHAAYGATLPVSLRVNGKGITTLYIPITDESGCDYPWNTAFTATTNSSGQLIFEIYNPEVSDYFLTNSPYNTCSVALA